MAKVGIVGCGYSGRFLVPQLRAAGHEVVATTTTEARLAELQGLGAEARLARLDAPVELRAALEGCQRVVHLAPPDRQAEIAPQVQSLLLGLPAGLEALVYGSTTGAFGRHPEPDVWIDESAPSRNVGAWGQLRLEYERGLRQSGLPVRILRIAGIYGPGRTIMSSLQRGMALFEGGPATSRVHVEDLARLIVALLEPNAPPLTVACDEEPAPTLDVARFACAHLGVSLPAVLSLEQATLQLSPQALEMRLGGRRCRSLVRKHLIGALRYPTYREGLAASLSLGN